MARDGEKLFCASKEADNCGGERKQPEDPAAREEGYAQSEAPPQTCLRTLGEGHIDGVVSQKEEEDGHVSETELLIAHVLAAMKDCNLFGEDDKLSVQMSEAIKAPCAEVRTLSRARTASQTKSATQTCSSQAHAEAAIQTSSSQAKTTSHDHMATETLSQACSTAARSSLQENTAALCIASLKHTHNKENYKPSIRTLDMQDERARPKFRNVADLYKLSEH